MNLASNKNLRCFASLAITSITLVAPSHAWATEQASLPWDYTLDLIQNFVVGPLAQAVIVISCVVAMLAFALAGDGEFTRRFARTALGTSVALIAVELLNYLVP